MAGPEDTTTSSQHGNSTETLDHFRLQDDDVFTDKECSDHLVDNLKPQQTSAVVDAVQPNQTGNLSIDLRNGRSMKSSVATQTPESCTTETSQQSCQEDQDSDVSHTGSDSHPHIFFMEEDDDEDDDDDNDLDDIDDEDDFPVFHNRGRSIDIDCGNGFRTEINERDSAPWGGKESSTADPNKAEELLQGSKSLPTSVQNVPMRSQPRPIPPPHHLTRASTSPQMTVCGQSSPSHSQVVVSCQWGSPKVRMTSSCPSAFSQQWTHVVLRSRTAQHTRTVPSKSEKRRRRNTIGAKAELQESQQQPRHNLAPLQDDPTQPGFTGRSRSYSDSDVQRLLMKEVGRELRRISDEFNFKRTRGKLTTVSESASEDSEDRFGIEV